LSLTRHHLDFLVIGAQKSGTTALYEYMQTHPSICMPSGKEAAYFHSPTLMERRTWDEFLDEHFRGASADARWGTATPHYMGYPGCAERIRAQLPEVRLIALLRDPIERAYSHYRMSVRRGWETRAFDDAVAHLLTDQALAEGRAAPSETNSYVTWGEYGRVLHEYASRFPRSQLLVLSSRTLDRQPEAVMVQVWAHVGVGPYTPPNLGRRYHVGGGRERLPWVRQVALLPPVRALWRQLPTRIRKPLAFRFEMWNIARERSGSDAPSHAAVEALRAHYREDARTLRGLGVRPDWEVRE